VGSLIADDLAKQDASLLVASVADLLHGRDITWAPAPEHGPAEGPRAACIQ
jgi:hypothetical protein